VSSSLVKAAESNWKLIPAQVAKVAKTASGAPALKPTGSSKKGKRRSTDTPPNTKGVLQGLKAKKEETKALKKAHKACQGSQGGR
jgi:hypothetical protein